MWIAVVIVVVLILLYFGHRVAGAVIAVGAGAALVGPTIMRGGWECINMTRPYGARCVDNGVGPARQDCELRCLGPREYPMIANIGKAADIIIKFTYDSGWNFPVPRTFLHQLATDPEMQAHYYDMPRFAIRIGNVMDQSNEYKEYLQQTLGVIPMSIMTQGEPVPIGSEPMQYFDVNARIANSSWHANVVIANNTARRLIHIEPNFGAGTEEIWAANTEEIRRLFAPFITAGYTFETTSSCPVSLQSLSALGGGCAAWSKFLAIWAAQNPLRTVDDVFQYAIGIGQNADTLLSIYVFYLASRISTLTYNENTVKSLHEVFRNDTFDIMDDVRKHLMELPINIYNIVRTMFLKTQYSVINTMSKLARGETQYTLEERINITSFRNSDDFWRNVLPTFAKRQMWAIYIDILDYFGQDALREAMPLPLIDNKIFVSAIASRNGVKRAIIDQILNEMDESNNEITYWGALRAYSSYKYPHKTFKQIVYDA